jgi:hypothetical protein
MNGRRSAAGCLGLALAVGACGGDSRATAVLPSDDFEAARRVEILGYDGDAMEPYLSCDGSYLFFNNRNDPGEQTDILYAERAENDSYRFLGPVPGLNLPPPALDAVPSLDAHGELFFISTRSYDSTLSTLYAGAFQEGRVSSVRLVPGDFSRRQRGWLTMDAEVSRDGTHLYFVDSRFAAGAVPEEADLGIAWREGDAFLVRADSRSLLAEINSSALEYAPSTSADGLELFFTRIEGTFPVILQSNRQSASAPFGAPRRVSAISGFAEAPCVSCDSRWLYYHQNDDGRFSIYRVTRAR